VLFRSLCIGVRAYIMSASAKELSDNAQDDTNALAAIRV
jgi:hypothetical protein